MNHPITIRRPCADRHPTLDPACPHCRGFTPSARPAPARTTRPARRVALPCVHIGPPTGERRPLLNCLLDPPTTAPVRACVVHGECTEEAVARGTYCCRHCSDRKIADAELEVTANGIGDHLMALTVAAGWKAAHPGRRLVLRVRHRQWVELFDHDGIADGPTGLPTAWRAGNDGHTHFVEKAAAAPWRVLPTMKPLSADAVAWADPFRGCVVLAPFTLGSGRGGQATNRDWSPAHWFALARTLESRGVRTVAIGGGDDAGRLNPFPEKLAGLPAVRVAALMRSAAAVVANESGMAHLAGALQVPCVVMAAQLDGRQIHGFWPRSTVIQAPRSCSGCHWRGPNYSRAKCEPACPNLNEITPEQVMSALTEHLEPAAWDDLPEAVRPHLARLVVPVPAGHSCPVPDRRPTVAAFLRHLSRTPAPLVIETGCQRQADDYGAGQSTTVYGLFLQAHGGRLVSLDNDPAHVATARAVAAGLPVEVVETDSVGWLRGYVGRPIDALYLDSVDTYVPGHAEHARAEVEAALPHLTAGAAVLIDDSWREGDGWAGKGRLAIPYLIALGWRVAVQGYQTLLVR